ncbi:rab GTPase-binding effector protein 2 [Engraulis encrasicolus]|uniref:rab GTPase-binding effector protein 2 n=1 Tax=Engraulis encrasicolus TaxID=184585 RepID=UPI002FD19039
MDESEKPGDNESENNSDVESLRQQLSEVKAELDHWRGVATICEVSKEEELKELQNHCDQEIQSLQEALRETACQYESRLSSLQTERTQWRRGSATAANDTKGEAEAGVCEEECMGLLLDASSLSSFSLDTPSPARRPPPQDDSADTHSLVSTHTLVPEALYLPPPGHRLVTHTHWDNMHAQVAELQAEVSRLQEHRAELEMELDTHTKETQTQVTVLQSQVQTSESLLQELQQSFIQSQSSVQSRLAELTLSHKRVCNELSRLKGEEPKEEEAEDTHTPYTPGQASHSEERLRIEIVNLKEQLDTRTEESEVLEVQLSSLKTETDRIQAQKEKLECDLQECRTELQGLRVALAHLQQENKTLNTDKVSLQQQCLELRSQTISLRMQFDTSQTVQQDFVQLSQSLQMRMEQIRQASSLDQVKAILGEEPGSEEAPPSESS